MMLQCYQVLCSARWGEVSVYIVQEGVMLGYYIVQGGVRLKCYIVQGG